MVKEGEIWRHTTTGVTAEVVDVLDGLVQIFIERDEHSRARDAILRTELFTKWYRLDVLDHE